jgi:hypothetical protein
MLDQTCALDSTDEQGIGGLPEPTKVVRTALCRWTHLPTSPCQSIRLHVDLPHQTSTYQIYPDVICPTFLRMCTPPYLSHPPTCRRKLAFFFNSAEGGAGEDHASASRRCSRGVLAALPCARPGHRLSTWPHGSSAPSRCCS